MCLVDLYLVQFLSGAMVSFQRPKTCPVSELKALKWLKMWMYVWLCSCGRLVTSSDPFLASCVCKKHHPLTIKNTFIDNWQINGYLLWEHVMWMGNPELYHYNQCLHFCHILHKRSARPRMSPSDQSTYVSQLPSTIEICGGWVSSRHTF